MITRANYEAMKAKRLEAMNSPDFITKESIWKAIRLHCLECEGSVTYVSECDGNDWVGKCPLHPYRFGHRDNNNPAPTSKPSLKRAIRVMCNQCMSVSETTTNLGDCMSEVCGLRKIRWHN